MLTKEEFPSINPDIVMLDQHHDLMSWELNESRLARLDQAPLPEIEQYDSDFHAAHEQATRLLKRNYGLYKFAQDCGELVLEGIIQYGDKYQEHKVFVLGENQSPEAEAEYDEVIVRFAADNHSFVALYGNLFKRKSLTGAEVKAKPAVKKAVKASQPALMNNRLKLLDTPANEEIIIAPVNNKQNRKVTPINIKSTPLNEQSYEFLHAKELKGLPIEQSLSARTIMRYAINNPGFLAVDLKKIRALKTVYGSNINNLANDFASIRDEIIVGLNAVGVAAKWGFDGQNKGRRYYLLRHIEDTATEPTPPELEDVISAFRNIANLISDQQLNKNAVLVEILPEHLDELFAEMPDYQMRASELIRFFEKNLDITYTEAKELLGELYFKEVLFKTRGDGGSLFVSRILTDRIRPQNVDNITELNVDNIAEKSKEDPAFDFEEVSISLKILDIILGSGHQNKGVRVKTILLNTETEESVIRQLVNRMAKRGLLNRVPKNPLFLQFPTQKAWDNYKSSKSAYVKSLFEAYNSRVELES